MTDKKEKEMSFLEHLEELRWHIVRIAIAIIVIAIAVFYFKDFVFKHIIFAPKNDYFFTYKFFCNLSPATCLSPPELEIIPRQLGEQFFTHLKVSFWLGLILTFPYLLFEIWKFIKPGLYDKEKKAAKGFVLVCSFLFLSGVLFGYYIIAPFGITFLGNYSVGTDTINSTSLASYVNYMTMFTIPTGIAFELPVVVYFLSRVGIVNPKMMRKYRKHAFVLILILAAVITPPDILTQILIGIPVFVLYEISIYISKRVHKKYHKND